MKSVLAFLFVTLCALGASVAPGAADGLQPIRIGVTHDIAAASLFIAAANGYFKDEGLDAEITFFDSDALVQDAAAAGAIDVGATKLDAPFFDFAAQHHFKIIASEVSNQTRFPATALLISKKAFDAGLHSVRDFPHRRIGMEAQGSGTRYGLARIAARFGFDAREIQLTSLDTPAREIEALSRDEVDAVALPYIMALQQGSSSKGALIMRLSDFAEWQEGVIFTRGEAIASKRAMIESFMRAYRRGVAEYDLTFQQRDDDGEILAGAHFTDELALIAGQAALPPALVQNALPYCDRLARLDITDIENQITFWRGEDMIGKEIAADDLLDLSFIGDHIRLSASAK